MKKRILVLASNGLLGHSISKRLALLPNVELHLLARESATYQPKSALFHSCDLGNLAELGRIIDSSKASHIINAAAYTAVDKAESEKAAAWKLNYDLPRFLAEKRSKGQAHLIHISTDYVFDGLSGPYSEDDATNALGVYGASKLAGDKAIMASAEVQHTIFRASVVYGMHENRNKLNFVTWLIAELEAGKQVRIVNDQFGNFTYVSDLCEAIIESVEKNIYGLYNLASKEMMNRYEFAILIAKVLGLDSSLIESVKTEEFKQAAKRPLRSGLRIDKFQDMFKTNITALEQSILKINTQLKTKG
jgi:dTDP-4-dehydrorhamnose reductase